MKTDPLEHHQIPGCPYGFLQRYALPASKYQRRKHTHQIAVHCSDTPGGKDFDVNDIRDWHLKQGWLDVGYHYIIRRSGDIETGRPAWAIGSGVFGHNHDSLHICLIGGGDGKDDFEPIQKEALLFLIRTLQGGLYPGTEVLGHRDFPGVKKQCPSFDARAWFAAEKRILEQPGLLGGKGLVA